MGGGHSSIKQRGDNMAKKKSKANNIEINYITEAEPRATTAKGVKVFCAFDRLVEVGAMVENPKNPNKHPAEQIKLLAQIIKAQGWRAPITVSKRSGFIVKGHGRLAAARMYGETEVPVDFQEYASEAEEYADLMADNRLSELAEMDNTMLADLLSEIDTGEIPIEITGYTDEDLQNLISAISGVDDTEDDQLDEVPEPPVIQISKKGDIWNVGQHRIICGDSTDPKVIDRLMQDEKAQVVNTDPPYGVVYTGGHDKEWAQIANDALEQDDLMNKLLVPAFKNYMRYTKEDAAFYIWHASSTRKDFDDAITKVGLIEKQYIIWVKNNIQMGRSDYQWAHEPAYYCEKAGQTAKWFGDRKQSTCWKVTIRDNDGLATTLTGGIVITDGEGNKIYIADKPPKGKKIRYLRLSDGRSVTIYHEEKENTCWEVSKETNYKHPTQKPVELAVRAISNSSEPGDIVADFFGGSHSTMIGAELTGRQARICELEPKYVDVGLLRYVQMKGLTSIITCERDGKTYDFLELCEHVCDENGITIQGLIDGTYSTGGDGND
jgi:DNA modification methylase